MLRGRLLGLAVAAATVLAAGTSAAKAQSKEQVHAEMLSLAGELNALKPRTDPQGRQQYADAEARYRALSASMGGDDPGHVLSPAGAGQPLGARGVVPVPPNCAGTTNTFTNSTPLAIPTGPAVVSGTLAVAGAGPYLWDLDLTITLTHTFSADLDITLASPAGTVVTLTTDNGAGNDNNFNGTLWDDDGNPLGQVPYTTNNGLATDHAYVNLTTATPLVPEETFGAFVGEDPNGTWTITISDDLAGDGGTLASWSLELVTFTTTPTITTTSVTNSTPLAIPTGPAVVSATLAVAGAADLICDLDLTTTLTHTFAADLDITLASPAGTVITLTTDNGAGNDNTFNGTLWDDDANPLGQVPYATNNGLATDHAYVNLTTATPLVPEESFGALLGEDPNGTWTVTISDDLAGDGGSLDSWTLDVDTCSCAVLVDLSVTKTDGLVSTTPGAPATYTITAANSGPGADPAATVADTFPAFLTGCTWTCVGAGGGTCTAAGAGNINDTAGLPSGGSVTYTANCTVDPSALGNIANTATVTAAAAVTDTDPANNTATDNTTVASAASLSATKTVSGQFSEGGAITYTVVISNASATAQLDNPGDEFTDTLPVGLTLTGATASSGTAVTAGNTVTWNGTIPGSGAVIITIFATIDPGTGGQTLVNQGTVNFDADGNGSNESTILTDDPGVTGASDGTGLGVAFAIPTSSPAGLVTLVVLLAALGWLLLRRP